MLAGLRFGPPPSTTTTGISHGSDDKPLHRKHHHKHRHHHHRRSDGDNDDDDKYPGKGESKSKGRKEKEEGHREKEFIEDERLSSSSHPTLSTNTSPSASTSSSPNPNRDSWMLAGGDTGMNRFRQARELKRETETVRERQEQSEEQQRTKEEEERLAKGGLWKRGNREPPSDSTSGSYSVGDAGLSWRSREERTTRETSDNIEERSRSERHRERMGFRRPEHFIDHPATVATSSPPSPRHGSPTSGETSDAVSRRSWRDRIKEKRQQLDEGRRSNSASPTLPSSSTLPTGQSAPSPKSGSSVDSDAEKRKQKYRFAGLGDVPDSNSTLPSVTEQTTSSSSLSSPPNGLDIDDLTIPSFLPATISLDKPDSTPASASQPLSSSATSASPTSSANSSVAAASRHAEVNRLAAKALKAKLMKDTTTHERLLKEMEELKCMSQADNTNATTPTVPSSTTSTDAVAATPALLAPPAEYNDPGNHPHNNVVILSELDSSGRPLVLPQSIIREEEREIAQYGRLLPISSLPHKRKRHVEKLDRATGERRAYRDDDVAEHKTVLELAEQEKLHYDDEDSRYDDVYARNVMKRTKFTPDNLDDQFDSLDSSLGLYTSKKSLMNQQQQREAFVKQQQKETIVYESIVQHCWYCPASERFLSNLIISTGVAFYLTIPRQSVLCEGHCLLVPIDHITSQTEFDENQEEEVLYWKKYLSAMYTSLSPSQSPIFIETVYHLKQRHHTIIHIIPLIVSHYNDSKLFFHQSLNECESEWSQHKKIIDIPIQHNKPTIGHGVKRVVPKGFPYFSVEFGLCDGGYVHVIEDEEHWAGEFGLEVIRGMLTLDSHGGRLGAGTRERPQQQRQRVEKFKKQWEKYDWTKRLSKNQS